MTVVIDANAPVALIASEPDGPAVSELIEQWTAGKRELHAPALARYEVANVLVRQHAAGRLSREDVKSGWQALEELPITYHALIDGEPRNDPVQSPQGQAKPPGFRSSRLLRPARATPRRQATSARQEAVQSGST